MSEHKPAPSLALPPPAHPFRSDLSPASSSPSCPAPYGPLSHCRTQAGPRICFMSKVPARSVRDSFASIVPLRTTHRGRAQVPFSLRRPVGIWEKSVKRGNDWTVLRRGLFVSSPINDNGNFRSAYAFPLLGFAKKFPSGIPKVSGSGSCCRDTSGEGRPHLTWPHRVLSWTRSRLHQYPPPPPDPGQPLETGNLSDFHYKDKLLRSSLHSVFSRTKDFSILCHGRKGRQKWLSWGSDPDPAAF